VSSHHLNCRLASGERTLTHARIRVSLLQGKKAFATDARTVARRMPRCPFLERRRDVEQARLERACS
jgi:hypothetical protein